MSRLVIFFVFLTSQIHICAQNPCIIVGSVIEDHSKEPIIYATILAESGLGSSTNQNGEFELKIPKLGNEISITISCIGYESKKIVMKWQDCSQKLIVQLEKKTYPLDEVLVKGSAIKVNDILKSVNMNLTKNYVGVPFRREEFVRVKRFDENKALIQNIEMYFEENLINGYTQKKSAREVNLLQGRILFNSLNKIPDDKELFWIDYFFLKRQDIFQYSYPYENPKDYHYALDSTVLEFEGTPVYVINYIKKEPNNPKNGGWPNARKVTGKLYVNEADFAIVRIEEAIELNSYNPKEKSVQAKKFDDAIKFSKLTSILNFKKKNKEYYLSYSHVERTNYETTNNGIKLMHTIADLVVTNESNKIMPCSPCNLFFSKARNDDSFWTTHTLFLEPAK